MGKLISPIETFFGPSWCDEEFNSDTYRICYRCGGAGFTDIVDKTKCIECDGLGKIITPKKG